jgi:hypothetical protein
MNGPRLLYQKLPKHLCFTRGQRVILLTGKLYSNGTVDRESQLRITTAEINDTTEVN